MGKTQAERSLVSKKMQKIMICIFVLLLLIRVLFYKVTIVAMISSILSLLMLLITLYFLYAYYKFSSKGGDLQLRISSLVINKIDEKIYRQI